MVRDSKKQQPRRYADLIMEALPGISVAESQQLARQLHKEGVVTREGMIFEAMPVLKRRDHEFGFVRISQSDERSMAEQREALKNLFEAIDRHPVHSDVMAAIDRALKTLKRCAEEAVARRDAQIGVAAGMPELIKARDAHEGGIVAGAAKTADAADAHLEWIEAARNLLATGTEPHNVCGKLSARFSVTATQIRAVLRNAGVLTKKRK